MSTNLNLTKWTTVKKGMSTDKAKRKFYDSMVEKVKNGEEVIIQDDDKKVAFLAWQNNQLWEMPIVKYQKKDE